LESTRFSAIETNFKDFSNTSRPVYLSVNVAIVDNSSNQALPILYLLKRDLWDAELRVPPQDLVNYLGRDPLLPKGPVLMLDRQQKRLYMADNSVVTYNHLVTFASPKFTEKHHDDAVSLGAVQTLIDALRYVSLRPPIPARKRAGQQRISLSQSLHNEPKGLDKELLKHLKTEGASRDAQLRVSEHWLFEVQT
jgi:hypothetical protein